MREYLIPSDEEFAEQIVTEGVDLAEIEADVQELIWQANFDWIATRHADEQQDHWLAIEELAERIARRIAQTPPIPLVALDGIDVPNFDGIDIEHADPETAERGDLWLTANDDSVMVLVTKVRPHGRGVVVVPVVFDIEVADSGTLILDNSASPLPVPLAIYDGLFTSLPRSALHGRVVPARDVDLLELTEADPGVSRGTPLDGPGDPRHEVRQDLIDRLVAVDRWP